MITKAIRRLICSRTGARKRSAFTLVEVLVSVTLMSVIIMVLLYVFQMGTKAWEKGMAKMEAYNTARLLLERMTREIKSAVLDYQIYFAGQANVLYFCTHAGDIRMDYKTNLIARGFWKYKAHIPDANLSKAEHAVMLYDGSVGVSFSFGSSGGEELGIYVRDLQFRYWGPYTLFWDDEDFARENRWGATAGMNFLAFTAPAGCPAEPEGYGYSDFDVLGVNCGGTPQNFFLAFDRWDSRPGNKYTDYERNPLDDYRLPRAIRIRITVNPRYGFSREEEDQIVLESVVYLPSSEEQSRTFR